MKVLLSICIALAAFFGSPAVLRADVTIEAVDVSEIEGLDEPSAAFTRLSAQDFYTFKGLEHPIIFVHKAKGRWVWRDNKLHKWSQDFPLVSFLTKTIELPDGTLLSGKTGNHLRHIKRPNDQKFEKLPALQDLYWTFHPVGSDLVFAKRIKKGPLLVLRDEILQTAPFPEKGRTSKGDFLPWYSVQLDGLFTSEFGKLWFLKLGTQNWRLIEELPRNKKSVGTRAPSWGLFQKGAQEALSSDKDQLRIISRHANALHRYALSEGYPTLKFATLYGSWHFTNNAGAIFGWHGLRDRSFFKDTDVEAILSDKPKLVRLSPSMNEPEIIEGFQPRVLLHDQNRISYQYEFETMPNTDRLYFVHKDGFAYYAKGHVTALPEHWFETVGPLPKFYKSRSTLYISSEKGLFEVRPNNQLITLLLATKPHSSLSTKVFATHCDNIGIAFFGWKSAIFALRPNGTADLIYKSQKPKKVYGTSLSGDAILFSEKSGHLKSVNVTCD